MTRRTASATILASTLIPVAAAAPATEPRWKVLLVVAHPDDEYYFAATTYRLAQELGAVVDQVVITNGEAGFKYATLAEKIYGISLTDETTGRSRLPEIRRKETLAAGRILGIRNHYFLDQRDQKFTLEASEALNNVWDCAKVRRSLQEILEKERYDFVFTMLPRESTHGHHQAATLLTLDVVQGLGSAHRPVVLAAEPEMTTATVPFAGLPGFPATKPYRSDPEFRFDRMRSFGTQNALRYEIVVNWVISEHKSQGMFQNDVRKHVYESFWLLHPDPEGRTQLLAKSLQVVR
jgi:LmbE family N-acetylglucosaminyl deacetylase